MRYLVQLPEMGMAVAVYDPPFSPREQAEMVLLTMHGYKLHLRDRCAYDGEAHWIPECSKDAFAVITDVALLSEF